MQIDYIVKQLDGPTAWSNLGEVLGNTQHPTVNNLIRHLRLLDAKSYVLESRYIDRDYSADYLRFYARTFRSHERHCKRIHFFSDDISRFLERSLSSSRVSKIEDFSRKHYCGFCVVRPLPNAPIGRTVLTARVRARSDMEATVTCRSQI